MKMFINDLAFKIKHSIINPILKKPLAFISKTFALLGGYYTICEIELAVLETQRLIEFFRENFFLIIIVTIIVSSILQKEKLTHFEYLGSKDTSISLKVANLLNIKGSAIVIPTNTTFDTTLDKEFISVKSVQGQFQLKYYKNDFSELDSSISSSLDYYYPNQYTMLDDRDRTNKKRYNIGTVAKVTKNGRHIYFLAVADVNKNGKLENVTTQSLTTALVGLWDFLAKEGHTEPITIPVLGTGRAGLNDGTYEDVIHETIFSFATKSQDEFVSKKMSICIYPPALSEANVTWDKLCNYLDWQCRFFSENKKRINESKVNGTPVLETTVLK